MPPTAPIGHPTRKPAALGINRLSHHDPDATSTAKLFESLIIEIVISLREPARITTDLFTAVILRSGDHSFHL